MTDDQKKMLTEWLGEDWYDPNYPHWGEHINRTFITWQDLGDVKDKLVEKGMWGDFEDYLIPAWQKTIGWRFGPWLFRPIDEQVEPHFCRLVAEFLEEAVKG